MAAEAVEFLPLDVHLEGGRPFLVEGAAAPEILAAALELDALTLEDLHDLFTSDLFSQLLQRQGPSVLVDHVGHADLALPPQIPSGFA